MKKVPVVYRGKTYTCLLYPRDANIEYRIEDDEILVRCSHSGPLGDISKNGEFFLEPIIFKPHQAIADKVNQNNAYFLTIAVENRLEKEIVLNDYEISIGNNSKQIVYFLK